MDSAVLGKRLKIGEVSASSGLPVKTIRYYEDLGLLAPTVERSQSSYRLFHLQVLERLAFIKQAQSLGLSLKEIEVILAIHDKGQLPCSEVKHQLQAKVQAIAHQIAALLSLQTELQEILDRWQEQPTTANVNTICPIIQAPRTTD